MWRYEETFQLRAHLLNQASWTEVHGTIKMRRSHGVQQAVHIGMPNALSKGGFSSLCLMIELLE